MNLRKWTLALLMAFAVITVSCSDDDTVLAPGSIETGIEVNKVELKIGEIKTLSPLCEADGEVVYRWLLNDEVVGANPTYTFEATEAGFYTLTFEVENESGKSSVTYDIAVITQIQIGVNKKARIGETLLLQPTITPNEGLEYKWSLNNETVGEEAEYKFEATNLGDFTVYLEVTSKTDHQLIAYNIEVVGPYTKGVFIVNEGWFGHEPGSVNFWDRESDEIECKVYEKANPGKELGVTTQYACIAEGKLFLVSKDPDHLVVVNSETLLEEGRVSLSMGYTQARGFAYQDNLTGYLSSSDGIYKVDLAQFQMGEKVPEISGEVGKMMVLEGKLFALQSKELFVINISTLAIEKTISLENSASGMVTDKDGKLWVSASTQLVKVDPVSLEVETIDLPNGYAVNKGWVWDAGCLTYSKQENAFFFVEKGGWAARKVAKYDIETKTVETICEIDSDYQIYGAGTFVDPISNKLYVTALKGFGQDAKYNRFYVYALDGTLEKVLNYEHFYFAALCVTNE